MEEQKLLVNSPVGDDYHPERVVDSLVSHNAGSLLYDLRTLESGWSYESPTQTQPTASTGLYKMLDEWQFFRFLVVLYYFYNIHKWFSSKKSTDTQSKEPADIQWKLSVSPSFSQIAVLKTDEIFIRSLETGLQSSQLVNIGQTTVSIPELVMITRNHIQQAPEKWRQIAWSLDEQIIAILCGSTGPIVIVSVLEGEILSVVRPEQFSLRNGVSSITFRSENHKMNGWELLVLGLDGFMARLNISFDGMSVHQIYHEEGLFYAGKLHNSTTCMSYDIQSKQLVIGGGSMKSRRSESSALSLSVWELLDEPPFHKLVYSTSKASKKSFNKNRTFLRTMKHMYRSVAKRFVLQKICFSGDSKRCAGLDDAGHVAIWNLENFAEEPKVFDSADLKGQHESINEPKMPMIVHDITWWSENAIAMLWSNGDVSVTHLDDSRNLLGKFAESFEPYSQLSRASEQIRFFVLETRRNVVKPNSIKHPHLQEEINIENVDTHISSLFGEAIEFLNESEADSVTHSNKEFFYRNDVRLIEFRAVTPLEFIRKRIELNQFEDALALAQFYEIERDLLYQHKWKLTAEITVDSILSTLEPIQNRIWVLDQCIHQVGSSVQENILLYVYALYDTIPEALWPCAFREWIHIDLNDIPSVFEKLIIPEKETAADYTDFVLIYYRLVLLHYLDRLYIYQSLIDTENEDMEDQRLFDAAEFELFKDFSLQRESIRFAAGEHFDALRRAFMLSKSMNDDRMRIMKYVSLTADPSDYADMLPSQNMKVSITWRKLDFSEITKGAEFSANELAHLNRLEILISKPFILTSFPNDQITSWFINKAQTIDTETGFTSNAEKLLQLGLERNESEELHDFWSKFKIYTNIVYQCDHTITWESFGKFGSSEILSKLLSNSTPKTVAKDLFQRCTLIIQHSNAKLTNIHVGPDTDITQWILVRYLVQLATDNHLSLCARILHVIADPPKGQAPVGTPESLIPNEILFIRCALRCVYVSTTTNWAAVNEIYQSIPERDPEIHDEYYHEIHDKVDRLDVNLQASELLSQYNISMPLSSFLNLNSNSASQLIQRICAQAGKTSAELSDKDWLEILSVILDLREKIFDFISIDFCYSCFCEALLYQQKFKLAREYLVKTAKAPSILLKVSKEYFNSAIGLNDDSFRNAEKCLQILQSFDDSDLAKKELNLHNATRILYEKFNYTKVPIQIRLADKYDLVTEIIHSYPTAYKDPDSVLDAIHLFDPDNKSKAKDNEILTQIAEVSLTNEDFQFAFDLARRLMERNFSKAWKCTLRMGFAPENPAISHDDRVELLQFSLCFCPKEKIHLVLAKINHLESIDHIIEESSEFNELLQSPMETHQALHSKMKETAELMIAKESCALEYLKLDSLFVTTLYDYHIIHSGVITMIEKSTDQMRIDALLHTSITLYRDHNLQASLGFFYQAIMCESFLDRTDKFLTNLFAFSDSDDAINAIDKEMIVYVQLVCFCLAARFLLHGKDEKMELKRFLAEYNVPEILELVASSHDDESKYVIMFHKYHSLLEQRDNVFFKSEPVPHSFHSLADLEDFVVRMLNNSNDIHDIQELQGILEAWSTAPPLPKQFLVQDSAEKEENYHILHRCWFEMVLKLFEMKEYRLGVDIMLGSGNVMTKEEENKLQKVLQSDDSLLWRLKIGLNSNYESIRNESLQVVIEELKNDRNGEKEICDSQMAHVIMIHKNEEFSAIIHSPNFYEAAVKMVLQNTVWDTSVPSLCGLAYPKDGYVVCSLPYFTGMLVKLGLTENAAAVVSTALRLPPAFSSWTNSMFMLAKFLENQQADNWKENAQNIVIRDVFQDSSFWDECKELCIAAIDLLPWVNIK